MIGTGFTRSRLSRRETKFKINPDFLCSTSLLSKILPTNLMACKPAFYIFIHHIWGKQYYQALFVYRTDFGQNSGFFFVIHNFARQIALIQYSRRSKHALTLAQQIIKVNHYKTGLFSEINLLYVLCGVIMGF